eukprot:gene55206-73747_t
MHTALDLALYAYMFKIGQEVRNLVTNAVKFTPASETVVVNIRRPIAAEETSIATAATGGNEVVDTGVGIATEDHSTLFKAFAQFCANELQSPQLVAAGLWISEIARQRIVAARKGLRQMSILVGIDSIMSCDRRYHQR